MPVCKGVVGASLQALFDSLLSPELVNFACQCGVEADLIEGMEKQVSKLLPMISDAEANQFKSKLVGKWLAKLKDIIYDAEDVLDLIQTESLHCKLTQSDSPSHTDYASPLQVLLDPSTSSDSSLNDKIKQINEGLEAIVRRKKALGLKDGIPGTCAGEISEPRLETSPLLNEPHIYGRDRDVDKLIKLLLSAEPCNAKVGVISIVGQGGIGKTTFAQRLYNHMAVESHFQLRAWVCVSDVHAFDVIRVTKGMIESTTHKSCELTQLPAIHEELKKTLAGKKFLLVLDDVWTEKYEDWIALSSPFGAGAKGSKVIITTRSEKVCSIIGTVAPHCLDLLSQDDSFSLFKRHAFKNQNTQAQPALERIGMEIVRKCNGLPLAIKALGGGLRSKQGVDDWKDIPYSKIWDLLDKETELGPALWLSYYHLPAHLKTCFAYCGTFPKGYQFDKEKLIRLWMAEGFLQQKENRKIKKRMEDTGERYFCELVSRSFFQQSSEDNSSIFVMHDLINDLAGAA